MPTQTYFLDSQYRSRGTNNKPVFNIPEGVRANSVRVEAIAIPHTFYNIHPGNQNLDWTDNNAADLQSTVPSGHYSLSELLTELGVQMSADTTDGLTYTATVNSTTAKITITNSGPSNFDIRFDTTQVCPACFLKMLGFFEPETESQIFGDDNRINGSLSGASSYTAADSYFVGKRYINIRSSIATASRKYRSYAIVNNIQTLNAFYVAPGINDIIHQLPVTTTQGDIITYTRPGTPEIYPLDSSVAITEISFHLEDENRSTVGLNGRAWQITLIFES